MIEHIRDFYLRRWRVWLLPTLLIGTGTTAYAWLHAPVWKASQALLVRDEAIGEFSRQGQFENTDARQAAQEMILQIAKSRGVVAGALRQLGPPRPAPPDWPAEEAIRSLQRDIAVSAPKGTEFGRTDVIDLSVKGPSRQQAVALTLAVCDEVEQHLQMLRNRRAESVTRELAEKARLAEKNLAEATRRLEDMEKEVGPDLGELRTLNSSGTGDSNLRTTLNQIANELRTARSQQTILEQLLEFLVAANEDPQTLVATPSRVLDAQPALKRLKEGLVDAQLKLANLLGKMTPDHPAVQAAMVAEQKVREDLHDELESAIRGTRAETEANQVLIDSLDKQYREVQQRLDRLAGLRARYDNLATNVQSHTEQLKEARKGLAAAKASQQASQKASLITRIGKPETGNRPVGPGHVTLLAAGWLGGLMIGIGCVLVLQPLTARGARSSYGRRWTDRLGGVISLGRRATDRLVADPVRTSATPPRQGPDADGSSATPVAPTHSDQRAVETPDGTVTCSNASRRAAETPSHPAMTIPRTARDCEGHARKANPVCTSITRTAAAPITSSDAQTNPDRDDARRTGSVTDRLAKLAHALRNPTGSGPPHPTKP